MTKWSDVVARIRDFDETSPPSSAVKRLVEMPALMSVLEANYRAAGPLKGVIKKQLIEFCDSISDVELHPPSAKTAHYTTSLSSHLHCADPEVSRWATIAKELDDNRDVLSLLEWFASLNPSVSSLFEGSMSWTVSECNKRKAYILPYRE